MILANLISPPRGENCVVTCGWIGYGLRVVSEKPWKSEAILRLGLSLFICQFLGVLALAVGRYFAGDHAANVWLFAALTAASLAGCGLALFIIRKPWDLERFTRQFVWMIAGLYLGLMLGAFVARLAGAAAHEPTTLRAVVATLSFQGIALILVQRFVREHGTTWTDGFGLAQRPAKAILLGAVAAGVFLPVGQTMQYALSEVLSHFHYPAETQTAVQALKNSASLLERVAFGAVAVVLAPVAEEVLFRGILYPAVKRLGFPKLALWGTSLLFAVIHFNLPTVLPLLLLALALTWLYEKTGNLLAPIAAHMTFNALNFVIFFVAG